MFDRGLEGEYVAIDCETMTSERFEAVVRPDANMDIEAIKIHRLRLADIVQAPPIRKSLGSLLRFIGGRPLVGDNLDFDIAMLDKYVLPMIGIELPNERIEISRLYYNLSMVTLRQIPPSTSPLLQFSMT